MKNKNWARFLLLSCIFFRAASDANGTEFESPSKHQIMVITQDVIKYNLRGKGVGLDYKELFEKAIAEEKIGFMGYHGDGIDFLIYQDIIRITVEEILGIPIRKDFQFVSVPIQTNASLHSLEELSLLFKKDTFQSQIEKNTFPLNFTMYSNHNLSGQNSVINFTKNLSDTAIRNRNELKQLFEQLGMDPLLVETLYNISYTHLDNKAGVLLQFFDSSLSPYAFANREGYASYPNGFIAENRQVSEYFFDNITWEFPQELRLILNLHGVLNPNSPIIIKRYTKIQPSKLKACEKDLRTLIQACSFDSIKRDELRESLLQAWNN